MAKHTSIIQEKFCLRRAEKAKKAVKVILKRKHQNKVEKLNVKTFKVSRQLNFTEHHCSGFSQPREICRINLMVTKQSKPQLTSSSVDRFQNYLITPLGDFKFCTSSHKIRKRVRHLSHSHPAMPCIRMVVDRCQR